MGVNSNELDGLHVAAALRWWRQNPSLVPRGPHHRDAPLGRLELAMPFNKPFIYGTVTLYPSISPLCCLKNKGTKAETPKSQVFNQDAVTKPCESDQVTSPEIRLGQWVLVWSELSLFEFRLHLLRRVSSISIGLVITAREECSRDYFLDL